ncbi:MAG TPA: isopentenyl phosphate kinase [Anaerolineaceae bacterium]
MLYFLKLGGSLITDKTVEQTAQKETLGRLAVEIADALKIRTDLQLVIGHGSGSFGHTVASKYGTRQGVNSAEKWWGFVEVFRAARALNQIVLESLLDGELPVIAFPPSAGVISEDGLIQSWDVQPLETALAMGLIPLINGDVSFDTKRGGTILSTEDLFAYLAPKLIPQRILLAGIEAGVWQDYPTCTQLLESITRSSYNNDSTSLSGSAAVDVTGGMRQKVEIMLSIAGQVPGLESLIFSGNEPGLVYRALLGDLPGTCICA